MESMIFSLFMAIFAISIIIHALNDSNRSCLTAKEFGFQKKWFGLLRKGIYKGRMVEILLSVGIQVSFNDYSRSILSHKEYFCLSKGNLSMKEGVIIEQLSAKLKSDLKDFIAQYEEFGSPAIRLCAYSRSIFFSKKYGVIIFYLPSKIFSDSECSRKALDIAVEVAKEMEKIRIRRGSPS